MRYHWGLGVGHLYTRIPGLTEPIPAGSPQRLINDHTGDLHSIPEPSASGQHPQNETPQPSSSCTAQPPPNTMSTSGNRVPIQDSGNQNLNDLHLKCSQRNENLEEEDKEDSSSRRGQQTTEHGGIQECEPPTDRISSMHDAEPIGPSHYWHDEGNGDEDDCASINLGDELEDPDVDSPGYDELEILDGGASGESDSEEGKGWEDMVGDPLNEREPSFSYD